MGTHVSKWGILALCFLLAGCAEDIDGSSEANPVGEESLGEISAISESDSTEQFGDEEDTQPETQNGDTSNENTRNETDSESTDSLSSDGSTADEDSSDSITDASGDDVPDASEDAQTEGSPDDNSDAENNAEVTDAESHGNEDAVETPSDTDSTDDAFDEQDDAFAGEGDAEDIALDASDATDILPEPGPNLLINPGFEDGDFPWNIWGGATRVQGDVQSGEWAIRATNGNGAEQLVTDLKPNATYRLSGWGKSTGETPMLVGVKNHGANQKAIQFKNAEYEEGSITFNTGFSNTSAIIFAYKHTGGEPGFADNLSLQLLNPIAKAPVWSDEFDGDGPLDDEKWTFEKGFVRNQELQWYQSENAFQEDGLLVIEGRTEDLPNPNYDPTSNNWKESRETIDFTSASVITKDLYAFQYGTLVVRAKVTNLTGTWPAIWTLGTNCPWPSNGEVDVMENYGGNILANFAWGTNTPWTPFWDSSSWPVVNFGGNWAEEFHIWELRWSEEQMVIALDGTVLNEVSLNDTINGSAECEGENPFQQPHYILLNLALGSNGGSVDNLEFPTRYLIDYVRVYE